MRGATPIRLLVVSESTQIVELFKQYLPLSRFEIVQVRPGKLSDAAPESCAFQIAVIDHVDRRAQEAQLEIAALKRANPSVRIVVITEQSTDKDAWAIEQGLFYYLVAPVDSRLVRVIEAAALSATAQSGNV